MATNQEVIDSVNKLASVVETQNDLIDKLPEMSFRINILWTVFCIICGTLLAAILSWTGYMFIEFVRSGGGA